MNTSPTTQQHRDTGSARVAGRCNEAEMNKPTNRSLTMYELNDTEKGILQFGTDEEVGDLANRMELYYDRPDVIATNTEHKRYQAIIDKRFYALFWKRVYQSCIGYKA